MVLMHMNYGRPLTNPPVTKEHYQKSTVSVVTGPSDAIPLAPQKKRPEIPPKPVLGSIKRAPKVITLHGLLDQW